MRIGIFDSGYGGLTIFKSIRDLLPEYDYLYLGDNARAPYGNRSFETVYHFTAEAVGYLFSEGCQLVVIACNTASAKALRNIQGKILPHTYPDRRVLGVLRPSVEQIGQCTRSNIVALWATEGTVRSNSFILEMEKFFPQVKLVQRACPLLVPLIEAGELEGAGTAYFVRKYWGETVAESDGIDTLLLACTHYPLLFPLIRRVVPEPVRILKQGDFVAPSLADYLVRHPEIERRLSRGGAACFLTTDRNGGFDRMAGDYLGHEVRSRRINPKALGQRSRAVLAYA